MRILRAADRIATPWKNGGGVTREVAAWPEGAGFDDFDWRVSMADVRADGPFSAFAGVDRVLAVLDGRLRLEIEGQAPVSLARGDHPAVFPGDVPTSGIVEAGPVLDLNVMTRRGKIRPTLARIDVTATVPTSPDRRLIVTLTPALIGETSLAAYDAVLLAPDDPEIALTPKGGFAYLVSFDAA